MYSFQSTEISKGLQVAGVSQGVVLWYRGALTSQWESMANIWNLLQQRRFWNYPIFVRTSADMNWRRIDELGRGQIGIDIQRSSGQGPVWRFEASASPESCERGFEINNLQPTLGLARASHVMVRFPVETDEKELLQMTTRLADLFPYYTGSAGYFFSFVESKKPLAFDQIWAWSRRFWGVEVLDLQSASWEILNGIYGINWLTLIGNEMMSSKLDKVDLTSQRHPTLDIRPLRHGLLVQAGPHPILGDMNHFEDVSAYVAASHLLGPAFLKEPKDFAGMFTDHKSTGAWIRRFLEPDKWLEPEAA
jgi:Type VI immunity for VRR-NUC